MSSELAQKLEIDGSALEGMLEQLVNQGRLRKVRQMSVQECQHEIEGGAFSLYGDVCAYLGPADSVIHYEIAAERGG
jgi:hypothetical protein